MIAGFEPFEAEGEGVTIHGVRGGEGPPLLLLHGFPQSHLLWERIAPLLKDRFTLVMPDLRGYGASGKPASGPDHAAYSKRAMAADMVRVMAGFGHERFFVAGHDRGGRVTHRMALDHPERIDRAAVLDIAPTLAMYRSTDERFARAYWHWFFLIRPQMKRAKEHRELLSQLAKGDEVLTSGGILGRIDALTDLYVTIEIADNVRIRVQKQSISAVLPKGTIKAA